MDRMNMGFYVAWVYDYVSVATSTVISILTIRVNGDASDVVEVEVH